jgi:flagellar motor switch protein FliG
MSPELQQVVQNIDQLPPIDRWEILEHLMRQFKQCLRVNNDIDSNKSFQAFISGYSIDDSRKLGKSISR